MTPSPRVAFGCAVGSGALLRCLARASRWLRIASLLVLSLLQCLLPISAARAQSGIDLEPPLIEHEVLEQADAALRQGFVAQVVDDRELASVRLHWRFRGDIEYASQLMSRVSDSSTWIAQVPTSLSESRDIEYYLEARDTGGNRTVRGFVFSPLIRRIVSQTPAPLDPLASEASSTPATPPAVRSNVIYYVLGALAIGAIAGLATAGGRSNTDPGECSSDGCQVDITIYSPVPQ